jgi:CheY-like chemotaxis protein
MIGNADIKSVTANNGRALQHLTPLHPDTEQPLRRPLSVLYVEDDADDVFLFQRHLSRLPSFAAEFVHAPNLDEARRLIELSRFDIVLCDFWLGCETTMPLIETLRDIAPVVLVSSLDNFDIEMIGRRTAVAGFVAKDDLSPAVLDRVFNTLVPASGAPEAPAATWLKTMLSCMDRMQDALQPLPDDVSAAGRSLIKDLQVSGNDLHGELVLVLAALHAGAPRPGTSIRFNALGCLSDAVRDLKGLGGIDYVEPAVPIIIETNASLFADVVQGFVAEVHAQVHAGIGVSVKPMVRGGVLSIEAQATGRILPPRSVEVDDPRAAAAANTRRLLVKTLCEAIGGYARFADESDLERSGDMIARLSVPLRPQAGSRDARPA